MRPASKLLVKPLRWSRAQWRLVRARARVLGKTTADYVRDLVAADIEYEMMEVFIVGQRGTGVFPVVHVRQRTTPKRQKKTGEQHK